MIKLEGVEMMSFGCMFKLWTDALKSNRKSGYHTYSVSTNLRLEPIELSAREVKGQS